MDTSFLKLLANSIHDNWNRPAFSNYQAQTYTYRDFGERIAKVRLLLDAAGIEPGDKVALTGRNSAGWAMDFLAILAYGAVAVPILQDFKPASMHHIVNHSGAKALFVSGSIWENLDITQMEKLTFVSLIDDLSILHSRKSKRKKDAHYADSLFVKKFKYVLSFTDLEFHNEKPDELALLSYTSGTSGFSKGVMIPYRALWGNTQFGLDNIPVLKPGADIISVLPMAHMYGMAFELLAEVCCGVHVHFLTRTPSPRIIMEALQSIHPCMIVAVPLIMEKIIRKNIFPKLERPHMRLLMKVPVLRQQIFKRIRQRLLQSLGGNLYEVIIGGAAFSRDVEHFLRQIHFPYTVGYGMTECAPLISYSPWDTFAEGSVGRCIERMDIRIDSGNAEHEVGEIQTRGCHVMLGYYNNEEATHNCMTEDGWLRTGDLGTIDARGNLYIRGRSKNMILGPNGQNIYPEEIEDQINSLPYVSESLVVERQGKLIALVHPDLEKMDAEGIDIGQVRSMFQQSITQLNQNLESYCKLSSFQVYQEEFEKTPKRSIKRYLYK